MSREVITCTHEAMATGFSIQIAGMDAARARPAARAAFAEIDRLEQLLSRFIEGSDIDRINRAEPGTPVRIHPESFECIHAALGIAALSRGAFDPTAGSLDPATLDSGMPAPDYRAIVLDEDTLCVAREDARLRLDLGGIGKGFAIDIAIEVLREWEVPAALVSAGGSTAAGFGTPGLGIWAGHIEHSGRQTEIDLGRFALAGSGTEVKGAHILAAGRRQPPPGYVRTWAVALNATVADALSTAFFMSSPEEIMAMCETADGIGAAWVCPDAPEGAPPATAGLLADAVWA